MSGNNQQWVWRLKGIGGILVMLEDLAKSGCVPNKHRIKDLRTFSKRVTKLADELESGKMEFVDFEELPVIEE